MTHLNRENDDIRHIMRAYGVMLYEVAHFMGVSESTLIRRMRVKLANEQRAEMLEAIEAVSEMKVKKLRGNK